jgi:cytochrome c biogenesis protein CcdA
MINNTVEAAHRTASAATYGGASASIYFGFSPGEWQIIGIVGGLLIGLLGWATNAVLNYHFKNQHLKLAQSRAAALADMGFDE